MNSRYFLISLMAVTLCVHLFRFPHLILENGGGAFLILYFILLNVLAFPLLVAEKVLDNMLEKINIRSLISIRKGKNIGRLDRVFVASWFSLRLVGLLCFLWFFLYIGSSALLYMIYFLKISFQQVTSTLDVPSVPNLGMSIFAALFWILGSFFIFIKKGISFLDFCARWVLPPSFLILFGLFVKTLVGINDFAALKTLFYPDFSALSGSSLMSLVGHSLASLFIGFGFYGLLMKTSDKFDTIEMFIQAIIRCLILAVVTGIMVIPMIEQVSETPFGTTWLFEILPRWLSYGEFGLYYCSLFFFTLCILSLQICVALYVVIRNNMVLLYKFKNESTSRWIFNGVFLLVNVMVVILMQNNLLGWSGQSLLLNIDSFVVNLLIPFYSLMMLWVVYRYTKKYERESVFSHQQVFFHNRFFYKIWEKFTLWIVPILIFSGWLLVLIGS